MSELLCQQHDHILTVTLNRPDIHNAISHQSMVEAIVNMCEDVNRNDTIRAVILTGAGKSFCAGGNIKDMLNKSDMFGGSAAEVEKAYQNGIQRIPLALMQVQVPVIAAVNGAAVGAGCDLALMSDVRICSDRARFAESFVKLGIIPGDGGAWFLPRIIGSARAMQMALTGEMIDAHQALEWGMVSEVTAAETLLPRAVEIAQTIADNPPLAVRATKQLLRESSNLQLPDMLKACAQIQSHLHQSADHLEAVRAMIEKRAGHYSGN